MTESAVQGGQVQCGVSQAPAVALLPVTFAFGPSENQAIEIMKEAVCGAEHVLDPEVV